MNQDKGEKYKDAYVVDGKLALPYQYFAGTVGSKFLIALRDKREILGVRCDTCGKVYVPPRQVCEKDFEDLGDKWVMLGNTGVVTNFTIVHKDDKHRPRKAPYILAMIKLDGADTAIPHVLEMVQPENVEIGMEVKAVFSSEPTNTILDIDHFEPVL